jgi:hypothetical protein
VEPITLTVLLLAYFGSLNAVWAVARRHERKVQSERYVRPNYTCSCTHPFGVHYGGRCQGKVREPTTWDHNGNEYHWQLVPCLCRRYAGDVPAEYLFDSGAQLRGLGHAGDDAGRT